MNMDLLKRMIISMTAEQLSKVGICALCKHMKSIEIDGSVECEKREKKGLARLACKDFEYAYTKQEEKK
jgi:hypothetical protein